MASVGWPHVRIKRGTRVIVSDGPHQGAVGYLQHDAMSAIQRVSVLVEGGCISVMAFYLDPAPEDTAPDKSPFEGCT